MAGSEVPEATARPWRSTWVKKAAGKQRARAHANGDRLARPPGLLLRGTPSAANFPFRLPLQHSTATAGQTARCAGIPAPTLRQYEVVPQHKRSNQAR